MENKTGINPVDTKILILPEEVEKQKGRIWKPDTVLEREQLGQVVGTLIAVGGSAFSEWEDEVRPQPGDPVVFNKYAGYIFPGKDGVRYRICQDVDICAILEPGVEYKEKPKTDPVPVATKLSPHEEEAQARIDELREQMRRKAE